MGTGPGYLPIEIAKSAANVKIVGIDLSRKLIKMARLNAQKSGFSERMTFSVGNAGGLRFDDASFDMVLSTGMLHSLKDPVKVFREIYRVLKRGGQAWIFDPARIAFYIDRKKWKASLDKRERFYLWLFTSLRLLRPIKTYRREQIVDMIRGLNFKIISIEEEKDEIRIKLRKNNWQKSGS